MACLQILNDQLHLKLLVITLHAACMFNFHNIIITFEHVQVYRLTIIFQIFVCISLHRKSMSTNFQIATLPCCICISYHFFVLVVKKNHMYTKYYKYHNLLFLYSKNMGINIIPVNYDS